MHGTDSGTPNPDLVERSAGLSTGVTVRYVEQGARDGTPVIFLHGVTDSWWSFEPVLRHLPVEIRAFAVSQRGHGDSDRPPRGYAFSDLAADLHAFMDVVDLPSAVLVGHSMGALVAQRFAVDHPKRVDGLVLTGAFPTLYRHAAIREFVATVVSRLRDPVDPAMVREFQASTLARPVPSEFLERVVSESLKVPARVWNATFEAFLTTPDFSRELAAVGAPALIVWGDRDGYAVRADQEALLAAIPGARLLTYEGGGHAVHWEEPVRFAHDVARFVLARRPAGTPRR